MFQKPANTFYTVQALRALAVLLVVLHHGVKIVHDRLDAGLPSFHLGNAGVDIFFVISGFVIALATHGKTQDWRIFLRRRVIRIVPMYWLATSIKLALMIALPAMALHTGLNAWHILASYLFIPAMNVEHQPLPVLLQGWTLSFEAFFYLCFAGMLAFRLRPLEWLTALFAVLALLGQFRPHDNALATLLDPLLLEFVLGLWIARIVLSGTHIGTGPAILFLAIACGFLAFSHTRPEAYCIAHRFFVWGLPAGLMVMAAVMLEGPLQRILKGFPHLMGDASYAIYLFHGFALQFVVIAVARLPIGISEQSRLALVLGPVAAVASGIFVHLWVEKPGIRFLRAHFDKPAPAVA